MQGSGDCYQLGEVQTPAVHLCPVSGDTGSHVSQGVPIGSSSGSLSGSGDFFPASFVAPSLHVTAVVGPLAFAGAFFFFFFFFFSLSPLSRSLTHASVAAAPQGPLVPHGERPCRSDHSVTRVCGGSSLVAPGGQMGVRCPPSGSSSVLVAAYRCISVGLGSPSVRSNGLEGVVT